MNEMQQLFFDAADCLEKAGHCKGTIVNLEGRMCMMGALIAASVKSDKISDITSVYGVDKVYNDKSPVRRVLAQVFGDPAVPDRDTRDSGLDRAVRWNNAPERTGAEVVAKLREIAAMEIA